MPWNDLTSALRTDKSQTPPVDDMQAMMYLILATVTHLEGGTFRDCEELFVHVSSRKLPGSPIDAFMDVEVMREFVRAQIEDRSHSNQQNGSEE